MSGLTVHSLDVMATAEWSFRDSAPKVRHPAFGLSGEFDPFPGYPHELSIVKDTAAVVETFCPPIYDVEIYVADREERGRSNGYSDVRDGKRYVDGEWVAGPPAGLIMLSGKRIPPHPALTQYLVAHEYGHHVEWMLEHARGNKHLHGGEVVAEYAKLRGLPDTHFGSGGRWHDSVTEIFACDFRIVVTKIETGYWPHPGIAHPHDRSLPADLWGWWAEALTLLGEYRESGSAKTPAS